MNRLQKIRVARKHGIVIPVRAYMVAQRLDLPFQAVCAFLEKESFGGKNVWGHDPTWMVGYPRVNEESYKVYKAHRAKFGNQGVGPMQLTHPSYQDRADRLGGAWKVWPNLLAGFESIKQMRDNGLTWEEVGERYNGAASYGVDLAEKIKVWRQRFRD